MASVRRGATFRRTRSADRYRRETTEGIAKLFAFQNAPRHCAHAVIERFALRQVGFNRKDDLKNETFARSDQGSAMDAIITVEHDTVSHIMLDLDLVFQQIG